MLSYIKFIFVFLTINLFAATVDFTDPTSTPPPAPQTPPDLSTDGKDAEIPQIATSSTGQYVYAIWARKNDGFRYVIQAAISSDYGVNWVNPTSTPPPAPQTSPDLSVGAVVAPPEGDSYESQIATSSTGQYVYATWRRNNGTNDIIQVAISSNYGVDWINPTTTTGNAGTPNLSNNGGNAYFPQIATSSTGQYVYAIWARYDGSDFIEQVAISSNYGVDWVDPTTTTGNAGTPNLSDNGQNAQWPQIATSSTGQYVYATWARRNDGSHYIIQVAISSNYGVDWVDPTTVTGDTVPNLSKGPDPAGGASYYPQIATSSTGQYVYVTWRRNDGSYYIIQVAISSNYGVDWVNPTTITGDHAGCLSEDGANASDPQIATSSTGQYIYAIWERTEADDVIEAAISSDYGDNWIYPTSTPGGTHGGIPYLSTLGEDASHSQIATSSTGQCVYAIWERDDVIQVAISTDYGDNWVDPTSTTEGTPALSDSGGEEAQITTSSTGKYVYATWSISKTNTIIQEANGVFTPTLPTLQAFGSQVKIRFPLQIDFTNKIVWDDISQAILYRIYSNGTLTDLIAEISPNIHSFVDHQIKKDETKTYYIIWVDTDYTEHGPIIVTIP